MMKKKYILTFFILISLSGLTFDIYYSYKFINYLLETMSYRSELRTEILTFQDYLSHLKDAETGQRGFILTGNPDYLEPYSNALEFLQSDQLNNFMLKQSQKNSQYAEKIANIREHEKAKLKELSTSVDQRKNQGFEEARKVILDDSGKKHMDTIRVLVQEIFDEKGQKISQADQTIEENSRRTLIAFTLGHVISILLIGTCLYYLFKYIKKLELEDQILEKTTNKLADALVISEAILNASKYAIIAVNKDGIINAFNPAAEKMLGYTSEELIGKLTPVIFHDRKEMEDRALGLSVQLKKKIPEGIGVFITPLEKLNSYTEEWTYIRKDGFRFPVLLSITALKDSTGNLIGYMGMAYDLTEKKELDLMKDELIAIASQDIRNPIASIKGTFDLLSQAQFGLSEQVKHIIQIGRENSDYITHIIDQLLELQEIEAGKAHFYMRKIKFDQFLDRVIKENEAEIQKAQLSLNVNSPTSFKNVFIKGDEDRLLQVMDTLIRTTIASSQVGDTLKITTYQIDFDLKIRIEIMNQGMSSSEEFELKSSQKFSHDLSHYGKKRGESLALIMAKSIIDKHKGNIGMFLFPKGSMTWCEIPILESINEERYQQMGEVE